MGDTGDLLGIAGLLGLRQHPGAQHGLANYASQLNGLAALQRAQLLNPLNAYTPPPETLESWFSRLERRANQLLDADDFMDTVEWMRWREELDGWIEKLSDAAESAERT